MTAPRSLDEVLADLVTAQDELLATPDDDFEARAALAERQSVLRREASRARSSIPDRLTVLQLKGQIDHLEDEIEAHLSSRPSASAGGPSGGPGGGGIDPNLLHEMHRMMAKSFGLDEKRKRLQQLRARLASLEGA